VVRLPADSRPGPQPTAEHYAIASLDEARAYLADVVLGERLIECTVVVNSLDGPAAPAIFGFPDVLKFRSCVTLFARAARKTRSFRRRSTNIMTASPVR